ncbi:hypothetical protein CEP52_003064 [Fusarium oligoseptatum]|uniref:WD40 repeat-like protein n=1 Tax=Fusarium oligoseptatum TaxID=2604345 RepID=A0A428UAX9_9HYPO|nr:hypothetical protein CEP52_003064 [Fusarium oligoseptatum]
MVIDALDECEQISDIQYFLQVLGNRKLPGSTLRILLTSRPEKEIEESLKAQTFCSEVYRFDLGEIPRSIVDHDISNLVTVHMEQLKAECSGRGLPMNFVDDKVIESLTRKSDGLFIYAEVACRYIRKGNDLLEVRNQPRQLSTTPKQRLESVLTDRRFQGLDALYSEILEQAVQGDDEALLATQLREVLELLVGLLEPIPEGALSKLCLSGLDPFLLSCRLDSLQSVLIGRSQRVQIFHESFRTFLVEKAGPRFLIQEKVAHMNLFRASLFVMTVAQGGVLKRDMCGLAHPGFSTRKIDDRVEVDDFIPPETRYACQYWVDHLDSLGPITRVSTDLSDDGEVHNLAMIRNLEEHVKSAVTSAVSSDLLHIVMDAVNFIRRNMYIAKKMPLQLYGSALIFSPGDSKIREMFSHEIWPIIRHCSKPEGPWNTHFRTLQGHENRVTSLSISSDGKWLATTCSNQLLIWNAKTELLEETFNWRCDTVLFSPKGQHLATSDKLILSIWGNATKSEREDLRNGNPQMKLKTQKSGPEISVRFGRIFSAAFSPNGQWIASATCSWDICLWDVNSGQLVWSEIGIGPGPQLTPCMAAVAFSPDGRLFGVDRALEDVSIYAVDASQPQPITYRGSLSVFANGSGTVFRPDNTSMAVPQHGIAILDFKEHRYKGHCGSGTVVTLAFSPDGRFFATQTRTGDVMIWRVTGVPAIQDPSFEASTRFLVFSPNGQQLYSGGIDHVVRVWDVSNAFEKLLNPPNPSRRREQPAVVLKRDGTQTYQASETEENLSTRSLCLSQDGKRLVSATEVSLKIWDAATGFLERECRGGHTFVILSPDDRWLVSAGSDSSILIWDAQTWTIRHRIRYGWETLSAYPRVSKRFLLLASTDRKLELWSLETGGVYKALTIPEEADGEVQTDYRFVDSAAISHDERWIACVYGSHVVLVWDTKTGEVAAHFVASEGILCVGVDGVRFSSDDSAIGVNDDGDLLEFTKIKDAATGKPKGHETTAGALTWALYVPTLHPHVQKRPREELQTKLSSLDPTQLELKNLPYMNDFLNEVLRFYPPAPNFHRQADEDIEFEGVKIPKGTLVMVAPAAPQFNPLIWGSTADEFNPDRWDKLSVQAKDPYVSLAFSNGPRVCIGKQFALLEMKVIMAELIRNFAFQNTGPVEPQKSGPSLRPLNGMTLRVSVVGQG